MKKTISFICLAIIICFQMDASQQIKAVIFDCDGTLVDSEMLLFEAWKFAMERQGYHLDEVEYWNLVNEHSLAGLASGNQILADIISKKLNKECQYDLLNDLELYFAEAKVNGIPPIYATVAFLRELGNRKKELGIKIGLASGNYKRNILYVLKNLEIEHYFDVILSGSEDLSDYSDKEGTNKPKPYVYLEAAKLLGVLPSECVAIEDSRTGVTAAVDAGCITIAVPSIATIQHNLSHAHVILKSFAGISVENFFELICDLQREEAPVN